MTVDFSRTSPDYARHRAPFAAELFDRLARFGVGLPGQHVLDVGGGTGLFAGAMAARGCSVTVLDHAAELLSYTRLPRVCAQAERMPLANESFDVVTAAQCWHWFDRSLAPAEILRVLRPRGSIAVIYQTYIPLPGSVAEATERLILKHRPGWRHANSTGVNGQVQRDVQIAGFVGIESFSFDVELPFARDDWRGFIRTTSPVAPSMNETQLTQFDHEHERLLSDWPATLTVPHRVFAAIARKPQSRI